MRKLVTGAGVAVAVAATLASATPASATPNNEGSCLHPGRSRHLKSLDLLQQRPSRRSITARWPTRSTGPSSPTCPRAATCRSARW